MGQLYEGGDIWRYKPEEEDYGVASRFQPHMHSPLPGFCTINYLVAHELGVHAAEGRRERREAMVTDCSLREKSTSHRLATPSPVQPRVARRVVRNPTLYQKLYTSKFPPDCAEDSPLHGGVALPLGLLDAVLVRLGALVVRRVVLGLGHPIKEREYGADKQKTPRMAHRARPTVGPSPREARGVRSLDTLTPCKRASHGPGAYLLVLRTSRKREREGHRMAWVISGNHSRRGGFRKGRIPDAKWGAWGRNPAG